MKFSIVISTYQRKDGSTPNYLTRALDSVFNQTHQDFKIYVIGDKYEDEYEIKEIVQKYDNERLFFFNLDVAKERDNYTNKWAIWSYGGVNAVNTGIDISMSEGNNYICHLDHDDFWENDHLELINRCIIDTGSDWVCTKSKYLRTNVLPNINSNFLFVNYLPTKMSLIHSSVCMNFEKIPLRYRDIFLETGKVGLPADADLWDRCAKYIVDHDLKSFLVNKITCNHLEEGYERI